MHAVLIGSGDRFGSRLRQRLESLGMDCRCITSQPKRSSDLQVDWRTLTVADLHRWLRALPRLDLIFFNQNAASLDQSQFAAHTPDYLDLWNLARHWQATHWTSCVLPMMVIHTLHDKLDAGSKIAWMLSDVINRATNHMMHADYVANKRQNWLIMQNFSQHHPATFYGVIPGTVNEDTDRKITTFVTALEMPREIVNGRCLQLGTGDLIKHAE